MSAELLTPVRETQKAPPRLCHIWNGMEGSWCGAKRFVPADLHLKKDCKNKHQICVVCVSMYEQATGRIW